MYIVNNRSLAKRNRPKKRTTGKKGEAFRSCLPNAAGNGWFHTTKGRRRLTPIKTQDPDGIPKMRKWFEVKSDSRAKPDPITSAVRSLFRR